MNIKNFDLNLLLVFEALMDERSVTRAAERLRLSQPAVSAALNRLRVSFDDPLFVRLQRGVAPTPRALELSREARAILAQVEALIDSRPFDPLRSDAVFRIGANDYAQLAVVAPLIRRLNGMAPNIRLEVYALDENLTEQLEAQKIDVAITILTEQPKRSHSTVLFRETYMCAARNDHPQIGRSVSLDQFCSLAQVAVVATGAQWVDPVDECLAALGRRRRVVLTVPNFFILPRMLRHNDFLSVAPERLIRYFDSTLKALPPPIAVPGFSMNLVWHEATHESLAHAWLRRQVVELSQTSGASHRPFTDDV